jgi:hypothetical protein
MTAPIDLFGGLNIEKKTSKSGKETARVTVEFTAPTLFWHADENAIAADVAGAIAAQIRDNLLAGRAPDGSPLPEPAAATLERREFRLAQEQRGGEVAARIDDPSARARGRRSWRQRFKAARLGMQHPRSGARFFGVESTLLARSVAAVAKDGVWQVFFAAIRAKLDRSGQNAVLRVFKRIGIWNAQAMSQPKVQEALRAVSKKLLSARAAEALALAAEAVENVMALGEELDEE